MAAIVVDSITPMTKDFTWEPSYNVTGGQQWFVVQSNANGWRTECILLQSGQKKKQLM